MKISKEDAKWILANYQPIRGYGKIGNHQGAILGALAIMRGQPVHMGCNCELPSLARITSDMFDQHKSYIEEVANESSETPQ